MDPSEAKVFLGHTHRRYAFKNLMCGLKLLANLQAGADNLVNSIFWELQGQSSVKLTNDLRRFIEVDDREPVKIGELERNSEAIKVVP